MPFQLNKKSGVLFLGVISIVAIFYLSRDGVLSNLSLNGRFNFTQTIPQPLAYWMKTRSNATGNAIEQVRHIEDGIWSPYMDVLSEEIAMSAPPLNDVKKSVSVLTSKLFIAGNVTTYTVGDTIPISITMYDGYGNILQRGGDQLRVRIYEPSKGAYASGYVIDYGNGSYTAFVKALWEGNPTVLVYIAYTREAVRALYDVRLKFPALRTINGVYRGRGGTKKLLCHPDRKWQKDPNKVCDMANINGGDALFCGQPDGVKCGDFTKYEYQTPFPPLPVTAAEKLLLKRNGEHMRPEFSIHVKGKSYASPEKKLPCKQYDLKKLWTMRSPVGHFYDNVWHTLHCESPPSKNYKECLRDKKIYLYGDSTVGQWVKDFIYRFGLKPKNAVAGKREILKYTEYRNIQMNFSVEWVLQTFPGNVEPPYHRKSMVDMLTSNSDTENIVFLIHMLCHVAPYHHNVFRGRMSRARQSIDALLQKKKKVTILVKGGHTFDDFTQVSDYYGYVYRLILLEVFEGLYDKVIYLDNKDMTIAKEVKPNHPADDVVSQMVNQMLAYICD